jgi:hypothetical protein
VRAQLHAKRQRERERISQCCGCELLNVGIGIGLRLAPGNSDNHHFVVGFIVRVTVCPPAIGLIVGLRFSVRVGACKLRLDFGLGVGIRVASQRHPIDDAV